MAELLRMPAVAAAETSAVLSGWPLAEGTAFGEGDPVVVVETDKAEVEVTAESDGVLLRTLVAAGSEVAVGSPIALIAAIGETVADPDAALAELGAGSVAEPVMAARRDVPDDDPEPVGPPPADPPAPARVFASPLARRLAKEAGLPVGTLAGTGPGGRIVRRDVEAAIASRGSAPAPTAEDAPAPAEPAAGTADGYQDIPHTRMRRSIAARLTESKRTAPHFYLRATCRADALLELRERINEGATGKVSVNDLLVKAVARAHTLVPEMNAVWRDEAVRRFSSVDVAVAVATDGGLVTPVLRDVEDRSVTSIAAAVRDFAEAARAGGLRQADLDGGSITVTNLGMFGVEEFAAVINPPQSAILAVGAAKQEAVVVDGELTVARVIRFVLSVDHRPLDGALAARWMRELTGLVNNPLRILV